MGAFSDVVETTGDLAVLNEHPGSIGVLVFDGEVVVDAAGFFSFSNLGSCDAHGADGVCVFDPVDDVDVMEAHIDVDVTALPGEVELIVELVLEFVPFGAAWEHGACGSHVPEGARVVDFADCSIVDAFDGLEVSEFVAALEPDADFQILFLCFFCGSEDASDADGVEGHRFLHEDVFSLFHCFLEHHGPEGARCGEDDNIAGGDGLFVAFEAEEDAFFGDIDAGAVLNGKALEGFLNFLLEEFCHGDELDVGACFEGLVSGAGGATATTDHGKFEWAVLFCCVGEAFDGERCEGGSCGGRFEEVSSGELFGVVHIVRGLS